MTTAAPSPAAGPVLVDASFDSETMRLTMVFDRDVNIDAMVVATITVDAFEIDGSRYVASGLDERPDDRSLVLTTDYVGPVQGTGVVLTAGADNGIVAATTGVAWAGTGGTALPFGLPLRRAA